MGSSLRLPLVITRVRPTPARSRWCSGEYGRRRPRSGSPGATDRATGAPGRRGASTIGRPMDVSAATAASLSAHSSLAASRSGTITANGLSSRALRRRSSATAASSVASTARWKPPIPFTPTIPPPRSASTAAARAASPRAVAPPPSPRRVHESWGPHAGHALGWAWNRRSDGVVVLGLARRAHREAGHRRGGPVVGHGADDRVPGTAVRAVGERVAVAAVGRVVDLGQARRTGGGVDADRRRGRRRRGTGEDREARPLPRPGSPAPPRCATRASGGGSSTRSASQLAHGGLGALDLEQHAGAVVLHPTVQAEPTGVAVHERSEAHALHRARDPDPVPHGGHVRHRRQQMRGSGSPTSMSTMRVPPKVVSSTTMPSGSALISPTTAALRADRVRPQRGQGRVRLVGGDDRDELALVGHVERVDAEQVAGRAHGGSRSGAGLRRARRPGWWPWPARCTPCRARRGWGRAASGWPGAAWRSGLHQVAERRGVGADVRLEREVAARQHHRHAVVGDGARHQHDVARLHELGAQRPTLGEHADAGGRDVEAVGGAPVHHLRVARHDGDPGERGPPRPCRPRCRGAPRWRTPPR